MAYEPLTMQAKPAHAGKRSDLDAEERHGTLGSAMARLEMTSKRQEDLPEKEQRMTIRRELIDELLTEYETPQDILGEGGLLKELRHRGD